MQKLTSLISSTIHSLYGVDFSPEISAAPKRELGEYCVNIFPIVKSVGKAPALISQEVSGALAKNTETFVSTSATGGYVNFFLTDSVWMEIFGYINHQSSRINHQESIVVDYIGMNVGKPPHIGHICTPFIGQSIINTARYLGSTVIGDSHIGDWGGLFGKLIVGYQKYGNAESLATDAVDHLLEVYVKINTDTENNPEIEQECRDAFKKLSEGDEASVALWKSFTAMTIETMKRILGVMHIHQDYDIGESFYEGLGLPVLGNPPPLMESMEDIVQELVEKGIATENEDGSLGMIFPDESKLPSTILKKRDGTNLYLTSDLAAIKYRLTNGWNPKALVYCVDVRQSLHLKQAFWIAKKAWPELSEGVEFFHAANGALILPEGAMSTRKGNIIRLEALVDEGFVRTKAILEEKGRTLSDDDIREITVGAIKYSYLMQDRERDIVFTWDKALSFEGHSGPYIQYAYVRARKILPKDWKKKDAISQLQLSPHDKSIIQSLSAFPDAVEMSAKSYKPHHIANYAYDLAVSFNSFYVHTPKILEETDTDLKNFRLSLVAQTAETLKKAFELLAIEMPSEM